LSGASDKAPSMMQTMLATRRLGASDLDITAVGFGAWAIGGGKWKFGWGDQSDVASVAAIHRAVELGVNWIDTAHAYGAGYSESIVARALAGIPRAERPYVFTKCAQLADQNGDTVISYDPASLRNECEGSLQRLKVDAIDLYQMHKPPERIEDIDAGWATLADLQREGKVRYIGVSNYNVEQLERARKIAPIASLQPPYNPIRRDIETEILPYCKEHGIGVIVYSPMASGILAGAMTKERIAQLPANDWRSRSDAFKEPALSRNLALVETLRRVGGHHRRSPGEVAIAWTLRDPAVTAAIVGARGAAQVDGWIGAASFRLTSDDINEIAEALP
jgi:aryl-alcohol dehydrogenase-like predicted oxidoreductase